MHQAASLHLTAHVPRTLPAQASPRPDQASYSCGRCPCTLVVCCCVMLLNVCLCMGECVLCTRVGASLGSSMPGADHKAIPASLVASCSHTAAGALPTVAIQWQHLMCPWKQLAQPGASHAHCAVFFSPCVPKCT